MDESRRRGEDVRWTSMPFFLIFAILIIMIWSDGVFFYSTHLFDCLFSSGWEEIFVTPLFLETSFWGRIRWGWWEGIHPLPSSSSIFFLQTLQVSVMAQSSSHLFLSHPLVSSHLRDSIVRIIMDDDDDHLLVYWALAWCFLSEKGSLDAREKCFLRFDVLLSESRLNKSGSKEKQLEVNWNDSRGSLSLYLLWFCSS